VCVDISVSLGLDLYYCYHKFSCCCCQSSLASSCWLLGNIIIPRFEFHLATSPHHNSYTEFPPGHITPIPRHHHIHTINGHPSFCYCPTVPVGHFFNNGKNPNFHSHSLPLNISPPHSRPRQRRLRQSSWRLRSTPLLCTCRFLSGTVLTLTLPLDLAMPHPNPSLLQPKMLIMTWSIHVHHLYHHCI
jgi:hypothetical protein